MALANTLMLPFAAAMGTDWRGCPQHLSHILCLWFCCFFKAQRSIKVVIDMGEGEHRWVMGMASRPCPAEMLTDWYCPQPAAFHSSRAQQHTGGAGVGALRAPHRGANC